jgi:uncharacterized protein YjbI with pentapeptide repeats
MKPADLRSRWKESAFLAEVSERITQLLTTRELQGPFDLRGIVVGAEGAIPELLATNLYRTKLSRVDLAHSHIEGSMSEATFDHVNFNDSKLMHVLAAKTIFRSCSLENAKLRLQANDASFEFCNLRRVQCTGPASLQEWGARRAKFANCDLSGAIFRRVEFRASSFENCSFSGAVFEHCDLRGTKFLGESPRLEECVV